MLLQSFLKIYFAFLFAALLFVTTGFSQSTSYLDSLDGKFALQFRITNNFSLSNFQGTILSGKYHFSNRDAIRLGVSLQFDDSESDEINKQKITDGYYISSDSNDDSFENLFSCFILQNSYSFVKFQLPFSSILFKYLK